MLHVQPGARRSALLGQYGEALKVAVQAPPTDGRANEALLAIWLPAWTCGRARYGSWPVRPRATSRC